MDWSGQINRFELLSADDAPLFAPPAEREQALHIYNRAIRNLHANSQDIAMIALRKLAVSYAQFPHPPFLLACCLAREGRYKEAIKWINQALASGLPDDLADDAAACRTALKKSRLNAIETAEKQENKSKAKLPVQASSILEGTRRRKRVRLANKKERQQVLRQEGGEQKGDTHVEMPRDRAEWVARLLPWIAGGLVLVTLVIALVRWLPTLNNSPQPEEVHAEQRLDWLVERLSQLSSRDEAVASLMDEYESRFSHASDQESQTQDASGITLSSTSPEATTTRPTRTTSTAKPSATPAPSPTPEPSPTPDPVFLALAEAEDQYEAASAILDEDMLAGADHLLQARALLADVPPETTAEGVEMNAGQLQEKVEEMIDSIAVTAANRLRLLAEPAFKDGDIEKAYSYYLPAYQLNPLAYGGGVAYYLGRCYQLMGNYEEAKACYTFVFETFADRDIASHAAYRLNEMGYAEPES